MKVVSKIKVLVAALAGAVVWSAGAELVVETKDFLKVTEPTTITGPTNIYINNFAAGVSDNSRIQADLSLTSQAFLRFVGNVAGKKTTYVDIGPASGDGVIRISTDAKSGIYSSYRYSTSEDAGHGQPYSYVVTRLGGLGGSATFDISGAVSPVGYDGFQTPAFGVWFYHLLIDEHATTSGDFFDIATINAGGVLNLRRFTNDNDANKPARILFNGGRFDLWYIGLGNDYSPFCGGGEGKTLILESVGDNLINLYKTAKGANLVDGEGTVKFVSANTLRLMGNSFWTLEKKSDTYVTKNYLPWNLPDTVGQVGQDGDFTARIDWSEFSGDIQLGGSGSGATGLQLQGNDQLPWGPDKGKMIIGLNSWSDSKPETVTEVSALILSAGKTVHLNGIENTGSNGAKCYVTNYNASATSAYATFVLGDGDVDGRLAVHVTAKCAIEKTGAGTLTIDNVTFDETATLALQAGKTIIDQDLYNTLNERGTFTIAEGATVICEKVIDVASGEVTDTTQYTDCADGTVLRIRKTGAGTLILDNADNAFTGGIVVEGGKVEIAQDDVVWTGAGADTSAATKENWKNSVLPNFTSPLTRDRPVFGEGGDEVVFPAGMSRLNGLLFNCEGDFTVEGSDATTLLKIAAPIEVAATASPHVYTITAPIGIENEGHAMTVGEDQTLRIKNVVKSSGANARVSLCGPGEVLLKDAAFAGVVDAKNNVKLRLKGNVGAVDDTDRIEVSCYKSDDSVNTRLLIDGATVDKPIHAAIGASDWIEVTAGSSNVFKKPFSVGHTGSNPATQFILKEGNVSLVFEGGLCEGSCVGMTGVRSSIDFGVVSKVPNVKFIFNGPLRLPDKTYGTAGAGYTYQGPIIIFNCTGNTCGKYYSLQYADTFFTVDNAFTDTPYLSIGGGSSTADFTTTRQEIPNFVITDSKGYLKGSYPATLAITEGWADRATAIAKKFGPSGINGWLKLEKSGPGYHVVGLSTGDAKAYASCGDIEVSGGTLEFLPNTTWQKGTNIIVRGTGRLVLNASNHFGSQAVIRLADTGKIVLPANTALEVKNLYVNGMPIRKGTYSYSSTDFPWLEGEGATITATSDPEPFVNVWTGAGADNLTTTAGNWEGGILDQRVVQTAEFGAGGDEAVFPAGETAFESIVFSREGGFTLRGVDETATVRLAKREAIAFVGGYTDETTVYTVEPKLRFDSAETTIDVKETNQTLVVKNEITGSVNLVKKGFGTLELDNAAFAGALTHTTAGRLVLKGTVGADDGATITNNPYNGAVEFAGATVNKNIQYAYKGTQLQVLANTTNSVLGTVGISGDLTYTLESNSQLVFDDVVSGSGTISLYMNTNGVKSKNGEVVFRQPLNITGTISCEYYHLGPRIVYEAANNHFGTAANKNWGPTYGTHVLKQSPAFDTEFGLSIGSGGGNTTVDLTTTHQRFARIFCGKAAGDDCGVFRGDYPAELEITEACADRETALADSNNFNPVRIEGCLKLTKSGTGYQILGRMGNPVALTSYGDIEVSDGVLEFADKVTWLNGTNFIVKGEGKLILTATDKPQIGPQAVFRFANNGEVEIPSGVTVSVAAAFVDGAPVSAGTYDADTKDGPMAGRVTGGGKLRVRSGMMLILR